MKANALLIKLLTRIRDSRLLWDVLGPIYNRRIYGAIANLYEDVAREMKVQDQARVLDAGSGRGYMALRIAQDNPRAKITGIDYSPMQVRAAEKHRRERKIPNCSFEQGNVLNIHFGNETFDAAVSIGSIKHWSDAGQGLHEIHRVLKTGALLIISETDEGVTDDEIRQFMKRFKVWFLPDRLLFWGLRNVIFGQSYSQSSLSDKVRKAGFGQIEPLRTPYCPYVILKARK